jgi:hypothetical protein
MWRWESYTDQTWADLFKHPAAFVASEDFVSDGDLIDWVFAAKNGTASIASTGFKSDENYYGYVYDPAHKNNLNGVVCDVPTMQAGEYTFKFYNVITGVVTETDVTVGSTKKITLPNFNKAIAFKAHLEEPIITSVELNPMHSVKVFPNPANGVVNIESATIIRSVILEDMQGRLNFQTDINSTSVQLSTTPWKGGLYLLKIKMDRDIVVRKILIQ